MSPVRTCIGCRERAAADDLLRVVADGSRLRLGHGLPGRGAWVHPTPACVEAAARRRAWARALRQAGPFDDAAVREHVGAQV